jgi:signal transduction histidine kinase
VRARLTASFVVLSVLLLFGALWIRGYNEYTQLRTHESRDLRGDASVLALVIEQREQLGQAVDRAFLTGVVDSADRLEFDSGDGEPIVVEGTAFDERYPDDAIETTVDAGDGSLTVTQAGFVLNGLAARDKGSLGFLVLLVGLVAALAGYVIAWWLSSPFRQLAGAAGQLGRGRFDLDLPRTHIPEARAISQALLTSAGQLQERLASEQAFAEHASHVLRTPLTGLRLELEELTQRDDLPDDVRQSATRSVGRIDAMDAVAGDLVALARRGALVAGAEIPLRDLATQCAQTWADALAEQDRQLTAAVEGSIETTYTPGPVEHILDLLLADVLKRGLGPVRMVFEADEEGHLSIGISCEDAREVTGPNVGIAITQARAVVTAIGGRLTGETPQHLSILLPRR